MIELSKDGPITRLVLNRPAARNALAIAHWEELADAAAQVARSDAQMLVVSGAGGAFSAGADLAEFPELQAGQAARSVSDAGQDARFDDLFGSPLLADRLSQRRDGRVLPPRTA
jgi:enoyl-CoA hydratase/carnithine racemase